ncbi:hypothetical protein B0E38_04742 [Streptomyces sp. 111WW2]|uniref:DUF5763 domain-containing protein n=1 Tax=Streptomyces sp. 111WW2 TaxID=1945515 RepID=UPI000D0C7A17|nr:DUF5763 domain-containing protein [Streptomyces sp. 111WW2]PSK52416.1 hypothetical protein B0E38_04742 [Streptomyces sp. 111WW2]
MNGSAPPPSTAKCSAKTAAGSRCKRTATHDGRCRQHAIAAGIVAPPRRDAAPRPDEECGCTAPRLSATTEAGTTAAEPCKSLTPSSALYVAVCLDCGGTYSKPWRRVRSET